LHRGLDVSLLLGHHLRTLGIGCKQEALLLEKMPLLFKSIGKIGANLGRLRLQVAFDGEEFVEFWHG